MAINRFGEANAGNGLRFLAEAYNDSDSSDSQDEDNNKQLKTEIAAECISSDKMRFHNSIGITPTSDAGPTQRKEKLPLPSDIREMFTDDKDISNSNNNNVTDHLGRVRTFAHVRGNWASFVYLPFTKNNETLNTLVDIVQKAIVDFPDRPEININNEFHLSLTKTIVLHHHWIEAFIQSLKKSFSARKRFNVMFAELAIYLNEDKTRTFVGINVIPTETLLSIIRSCDICLSEYDLERYYDNASFHISIAWCVGNQESWMKAHLLPILNCTWSKTLDGSSTLQQSTVEALELKTGNKVYKFLLEDP